MKEEIRQIEAETDAIRKDIQYRKQENVNDLARAQKSIETLHEQYDLNCDAIFC